MEKYSPDELLDRSISDTIRQTGDEMKMDVWYPARTDMECVTAYRSFLPVIMYYHARLSDWSLYFRTCKVCSRVFLAKSQKYTMCSDKCRQKMKTQAKRDFDARALENGYDHIYKNETQRWRHQLNKAQKNASPVQLEKMKESYQALRKEALKRKNDVKIGRSTEKEFADWIFSQTL